MGDVNLGKIFSLSENLVIFLKQMVDFFFKSMWSIMIAKYESDYKYKNSCGIYM